MTAKNKRVRRRRIDLRASSEETTQIREDMAALTTAPEVWLIRVGEIRDRVAIRMLIAMDWWRTQ